MQKAYFDTIFNSIVAGKLEDTVKATKDALEDGADPQYIISEHMIRAMEEIGDRFQNGKAYVPELLMSARAMKGALELIKPLLQGDKPAALGKIAIGTVYGDLHDIGKNLVASMFEGCGFEVINLGVNVSAGKFIETVKNEKIDILCMSALLTTTMNYMKTVIDELTASGLRDKVKVMVGGAPLNEKFAMQIGADAYTDNANSAVAVAKKLVAKN